MSPIDGSPISLKLTHKTKKAVQRAARARGVTPSQYMREVIEASLGSCPTCGAHHAAAGGQANARKRAA